MKKTKRCNRFLINLQTKINIKSKLIQANGKYGLNYDHHRNSFYSTHLKLLSIVVDFLKTVLIRNGKFLCEFYYLVAG
jgi:hypothetical protein